VPESEWCYRAGVPAGGRETVVLEPGYTARAGYRLPTEAEWEHACRAGATTRFCFGEAEALLGEYAWYGANAQDRPWPVGRKKPNDIGLFDMHGNLIEWTHDRLRPWDGGGEGVLDDEEDPGPIGRDNRVMRGGSYSLSPNFLRSADRYRYEPGGKQVMFGFRVARTAR
jgi:formylglycine-generating enzyme required for sulfatase activity